MNLECTSGERRTENDGPDISVIIPCYNQERFLPEAVESIVNQTYRYWECVIVNDGSTDHTEDTARNIITKYSEHPIRLITKKNGGVAEARNTGIAEASYDWVLPLDCDDLLERSFLKKAAEIMGAGQGADIVFSNMEVFGDRQGEWIPEAYSKQRVLEINTMPYAGLFRKNLWEKAGGYNPVMGKVLQLEDWDFWIRCSIFDPVVKRIPEKLFRYRVHSSNIFYSLILPNQDCARALTMTAHPDLYSLESMIAAMQIIADCPDTIFERVSDTVRQYPHASLPYLWRGLKYENMGNIKKAIADYETSVKLAPTHDWQPFLRLLLIHQNRGNSNQSDTYLREVIDRMPKSLWPEELQPMVRQTDRGSENIGELNSEGEDLFKHGDMAGAREAFEQAIALDPKNATAHNNLGTIYWYGDQKNLALECFNEAFGLDPDDKDIKLNVIRAMVEFGFTEDALSLSYRHMEGHPDDRNFIRYLNDEIPEIDWKAGIETGPDRTTPSVDYPKSIQFSESEERTESGGCLIPTARAVVDVNRPCNAKCKMCYYTYEGSNWSKSIDAVNAEIMAAKQRGNTSIDFTGGEPTIYPHMAEAVRYAESIGLHTCIITNGLALNRIKQLVDDGCREWLVSIHGFEDGQDRVLDVPGAWEKTLQTVRYLNGIGCFVRVNSTLTRFNYTDLPRLSRFFIEELATRIVNFINFNPHYEWGRPDQPKIYQELNRVQVRVSDVAPYLKESLRLLNYHQVWTNVRYFPLCVLNGYESNVCNIPQVMFDPYEWDYGVTPKTVSSHRANGKRMQEDICSGEGVCKTCGMLNVCGGINKNYAQIHGYAELRPYSSQSNDPHYFKSIGRHGNAWCKTDCIDSGQFAGYIPSREDFPTS